jgi:hypothetical protein
VAAIALSTTYVLLNQPVANTVDERSVSLGDNSIITGPAGVPMATPPAAIYPHQYFVLFNVDSYMLMYNNSTSQYVADLELISGTLSNATAVALVRSVETLICLRIHTTRLTACLRSRLTVNSTP